MDELDLKILDTLQNFGIRDMRTVAEELGVHKSTIHRRINNMISQRAIKIIAVPNLVKLGYEAWAQIGIRVQDRPVRDVAMELVKHPLVYFVSLSSGTFDILIGVYFRSFDRLAYFTNSELSAIKGIAKVETLPYISPRKYYNFSWPAPSLAENIGSQVISQGSNHQIDDTDRKILRILSTDSTLRPEVLKTKLGIGENTLRKRIKNMRDNEIFKDAIVWNPSIMPYELLVGMGINTNYRPAHEVIDDFLRHHHVYLASASLGRFNVIVYSRFQSARAFGQFLSAELPTIKGVDSIDYFLSLKQLKYHGIEWSETGDWAINSGL